MPTQMISSLAHIPGLRRLEDICREFKIDLIAQGGFVRRVIDRLAGSRVTSPERQNIEALDLFDLNPVMSDIDLRHTGPAEISPIIHAAILEVIPYAECFRWEVRATADDTEFEKDRQSLPLIPANRITLSVERGGRDPYGGIKDIAARRFRFEPGHSYQRSALLAKGEDHPVLHWLFYTGLLMEHGSQSESWKANEWFKEQVGEGKSASQEELPGMIPPRLRTRILYRLKALRDNCRSDSAWERLFDEHGMKAHLLKLGVSAGDDFEAPGEAALLSSCAMDDNALRASFADTTRGWDTRSPMESWAQLRELRPLFPAGKGAAVAGFPEVESGLYESSKSPADWPPGLDDGQEIVAASPKLKIRLGEAPSGKLAEQLIFQSVIPDNKWDEKELGLLSCLSTTDGAGMVFTQSAFIRNRAYEDRKRLGVRMDIAPFLGLLRELNGFGPSLEIASQRHIQLFIVKCR